MLALALLGGAKKFNRHAGQPSLYIKTTAYAVRSILCPFLQVTAS